MKNNLPLRIVHALMIEFVGDVTKLKDEDLDVAWLDFKEYYRSVRKSIHDMDVLNNI